MEEFMSADLLDLLDSEEHEEVWTERPEREGTNLTALRARETVTLTFEKFKRTGEGNMDMIERAHVLAALAGRAAADGVRADSDDQCALAEHYASESMRCMEGFAVEPSNLDPRSKNNGRVILK